MHAYTIVQAITAEIEHVNGAPTTSKKLYCSGDSDRLLSNVKFGGAIGREK